MSEAEGMEHSQVQYGGEGGSERLNPKITKELTSTILPKDMSDLIHGHIVIHPLVNAIIDTPQFQRLRNIKQLGMVYYVYPAASHNRFEHSLGTYHLAGKLMGILNEKRKGSEEEREEWEKEKLCVQIAGLCHDLGHGPFSHLWEMFLKRCGIDDWTHEDNTIKMFDLMLEELVIDKHSLNQRYNRCLAGDNGDPYVEERIQLKKFFQFYNLYEEEINLIKDMIIGKPAGSRPNKKHYLYQIINNTDNDIDVDKFDYICRDSKMLNLDVHFDLERIMLYSQIMEEEVEGKEIICFREKILGSIKDLFMARGVLHDKAYQHPKVKIIEEMFIDALVMAAESSDSWRELKSTKPEVIQYFTDYVFDKILLELPAPNKAKQLLLRVFRRDLYSLLFEMEIKHTNPIDQNMINRTIKKVINKLFEDVTPADANLGEQDLGIITMEINIGKSNEVYPLKEVYVFGKPTRRSRYAKISAKECDWKKCTSLTPDLDKYTFRKILKRKLLVIYKGKDDTVLNQLYKDIPIIKEVVEVNLALDSAETRR